MNAPKLREAYLGRCAGRRLFDLGDVAAGWGALFAGCDFFAGYPITPATEIAEFLARELPKTGGRFIQMEDELASMSAVIGAAWGGGRDMMQARWGTHGDHEMVALCPNSAQECFDQTIRAFDIARSLRMPVMLMLDGEIGHLRETFDLRFPPPMNLPVPPDPSAAQPFGGEPVPPLVRFGEARYLHVTGSTHKPDGTRDVTTPEVHDLLVRRLCRKVEQNRRALKDVEKDIPADAQTVVICYGAPSRPAQAAVIEARHKGLKVGFLRLRTAWPFPGDEVAALPEGVRTILVPEMNLGQMSREVERYTDRNVLCVSKIGGVTHTKREIGARIEEVS
jgi:2-oxoglutarate ferredoxin oxidoreductase subunit alpha